MDILSNMVGVLAGSLAEQKVRRLRRFRIDS
jgi:hypothetical protein